MKTAGREPRRSRKWLPALIVEVLLVSIVMPLTAAPTAGATVPTTPWQTTAEFSSTDQLTSVSCPSSTCVAVGNGIVTFDGAGGSGVPRSFPALTSQPRAVSCPTTSDCFAVSDAVGENAGTVISSTDGGDTWTLVAYPNGVSSLTDIACGSPTQCVALGFDKVNAPEIVYTKDGGATWEISTLPSTIGFLSKGYDVTCISNIRCMAITSIVTGAGSFVAVLVTTDSGAHWAVKTVRPETPNTALGEPTAYGIACATASDCVVAGTTAGPEVYATNDGGTTWTDEPVPSGVAGLRDVACPSSTSCIAVGDGANDVTSAIGTSDGGAQWETLVLPPSSENTSGLESISCSSTTQCMAVGCCTANSDIGLSTIDGGAVWSTLSTPPPVNEFNDISCPSASNCVAVGDALNVLNQYQPVIATSSDGGLTWEADSAPSGVAVLSGVTCISPSNCIAVGFGGEPYAVSVIRTTNGGSSWTKVSPANVPSSGLSDLDCPTATRCLAIGDLTGGHPGIVLSNNAGKTWTAAYQTDALSLRQISCPTALSCTVVGSGAVSWEALILTTQDGGASWSPEYVAADSLDGVSCPSATACVAVGSLNNQGAIFRTVDGGVTWNALPLPSGIPDPGYSWTIGSVDCPAVSDCVASALGLALVSDDEGNTWFLEPTPHGISRVDCATTTACVAVGTFWSGENGADITTGGIQSLAVNSAELPPATVEAAYQAGLEEAGGTAPYTWSLSGGSLPTGLSLDPTTGTITGVPQEGGTFDPQFTVTDSAGESAGVTLPLTVQKLTPTVTASVSTSSSIYGYPVTYTADVTSSTSPAPTGAVTFRVDSVTLCTGAIDAGVASCDAGDAPAGTDTVTATYEGDDVFTTAQADTSISVAQGPSTTAITAPTTAHQGALVAFSATVTPGTTATGTITFTAGPSVLCTAHVTQGAAGCAAFVDEAPGAYIVVGDYSGDSNFYGSAGLSKLTIVRSVTIASSANPVTTGQTVTFTATIHWIRGGGTVTFTASGKAIPVCLAQPLNQTLQAVCTTAFSKSGSFSIQADYTGSNTAVAQSKFLAEKVT